MIQVGGRGVLVVDSQIHIWIDESGENEWKPEWRAYAHRNGESPTVAELTTEMDRAGVDRAILVPPTFAGESNQAALQAATEAPDRFKVMARIPLDNSEFDVAHLMAEPNILGVRLSFARGTGPRWLISGLANWFWQFAADNGVPCMVYAPRRIDILDKIVRRFPGLRVILDHVCLPTHDLKRHELEDIVSGVQRMSRYVSVGVKISALPYVVDEPYPYPTAQDVAHRIVDAYGKDRVFWGSDLTRSRTGYTGICDYLAAPGGLPEKALDSVMGAGLCRYLGWD